MTAFSYTAWAMMSPEEQKNSPGVGISRGDIVNNPDRGVYWGGSTAASALSRHVEATLTGDDELASKRMWNSLKGLHRRATESPRMIDRAMQPRQADAHVALGAYNGDLDHQQLEQLTSVFDDVQKLQVEAQLVGVDPIQASRRMLDRAASRAVGYQVDDARIENEMKPLTHSPEGQSIIANLNQSVRQMQSLIKDMPLDALDDIAPIGRGTEYGEDERKDHARLNDILASIPLVLNPIDVEPERVFSVRMETQEEATVMETMIRWAGSQATQPEPQEVNRAFASWRDNGMAESPYSNEREKALGIVVGSTAGARDNLVGLVGNLDSHGPSSNSPIIVLTVDADKPFRDALAATGRTVVDVEARATGEGVHLSSRDQDLPSRRVELVSLTLDQAADPIARSLAVNGVVGRSEGIAHLAGKSMSTVEAQAIHLAGTLRKLSLAMDEKGRQADSHDLRSLRAEARDVDSAADPQRYYTAGHARPHRGVNSVAFEGARNFDAANRKNAPNRDLIGEAYDSIPKDTTILTVDKPENAVNKWMDKNATDRRVLYAEATRSLSFAEITGGGLDGEKKVARESGMEFKIYERPPEKRQYGFKQENAESAEYRNVTNYRPKNAKDPARGETANSVRRVCLDEDLGWDHKMVRGAIILVSGNAAESAINGSSQAVKVAQEAVMDRAHTALIVNDFRTDFHGAHMIRLAHEMGKQATVLDGAGKEVPLGVARERTKHHAENFSEKQDREIGEQMSTRPDNGASGRNSVIDVAAKDDLGQLALASLPGMDAARAIQFAHTDVTLKEIRNDKSEEMRKHLIEKGMPAETRKIINDIAPWSKAMDRALADSKAAEQMGAKLHVPTDVSHPVELASGLPVKHAVFTIGGYDFEKQPLAAFIGNAEQFRQPGAALTLSEAQKAGPGAERGSVVDPADVIDRKMVRRTIEEMTAAGYGIGVTLEEGVSRAVLEEAAKVRDAKVVVVAPGNFQAASPQLRSAVKTLFEQDRAAVVMPTSIAPHAGRDPKPGEERRPDTYVENRDAMHDIMARTAKVGIVLASGEKDQSLHMVRRMVELDKPIAAIVPQDPALAGTELYSGNMKLLKGAGKTSIQSISRATAPSAQAYAEIKDEVTQMVLENGVRRGNAGTFSSARLGRSDMLRSGHHNLEFGWAAGAHPISSAASIERFVDKVELGEGALGVYKAPDERTMEKVRLARERSATARSSSEASRFVAEQFSSTSALHRGAIEKDAGTMIQEEHRDFAKDQAQQARQNAMASAGGRFR